MLPKNLANVNQFLKNNENGIIVVYGPTGSGKTSFSLEVAKIAQDLNFFPVIISADFSSDLSRNEYWNWENLTE